MQSSNTKVFKDVVTIGSMIAEFQIFNTEGLFSIVRLLFHDLRVDKFKKNVAMHSELILELLYREIFDQNWGKTTKNLNFI